MEQDANKTQSEEQLYPPDNPTATDLEQLHLSNGLAIMKYRRPNDVQTQFIRWRDVWDNNMKFWVSGQNENNIYRAIALSIPQYVTDERNFDGSWIRNMGYVVGIRTAKGTSPYQQIYSSSAIRWVDEY
jgi:hypothetical protein